MQTKPDKDQINNNKSINDMPQGGLGRWQTKEMTVAEFQNLQSTFKIVKNVVKESLKLGASETFFYVCAENQLKLN